MSMHLGLVINLHEGVDIDKKFSDLLSLGFSRCQIISWDEKIIRDPSLADTIKKKAERRGIFISVFWCGYPGKVVWDFVDGPSTIGLVPPATREERLETLKAGALFASHLGVKYLATHVGFLPEDQKNIDYLGTVKALESLLATTKKLGLTFLFETGQETPTTLLRCIEDLGKEGVGINLDAANLLLYGKANPVDALSTFGKYVYELHGKDGEYPTNGNALGKEVPLGEGKVDYPDLLKKLHSLGFEGDITIEREIEEGEEQKRDILNAKKYLEGILENL